LQIYNSLCFNVKKKGLKRTNGKRIFFILFAALKCKKKKPRRLKGGRYHINFKQMGLFKTDNSTHVHEHYHTSTLGALANAYASRKNAQDAKHAAEHAAEHSPEAEMARAEKAKAYAEIETAKIKAKSDKKLIKKQLKHEEDLKLMETDPEAYRKKQMFRMILIIVGVIVGLLLLF